MAAPQTHFVVTWMIFRVFTWIFGITFSACETVSIFFFGVFIDIDHFFAPAYVKDIFLVRIPRALKGGAVGAPSKGIKGPTCWLHIWSGFLLACVCSAIFYFMHSTLFYVPVLFYVIHYWGIDRWQISMPHMPPYDSFLYPLKKKGYIRKKGYLIKTNAEVIPATIISAGIILFELFRIVF